MALDTGGNVKVDFVWGNFPLQPDDVREGTGPVVVSAANAAQNYGWSGWTVYPSRDLDPALDNHVIAAVNWNGFPDYTPAPPFLDTVDQAAIPNVVGMLEAAATSALTTAGFVKGAVTETGVGATVLNDGKVRAQVPAASVVANLGDAVALSKFLAPTVPNVVALTEAAAETALQGAGLVKGDVTTTADGATVENDGTVASQTPVSGTKADTGSAVDVVLYAYVAP